MPNDEGSSFNGPQASRRLDCRELGAAGALETSRGAPIARISQCNVFGYTTSSKRAEVGRVG